MPYTSYKNIHIDMELNPWLKAETYLYICLFRFNLSDVIFTKSLDHVNSKGYSTIVIFFQNGCYSNQRKKFTQLEGSLHHSS